MKAAASRRTLMDVNAHLRNQALSEKYPDVTRKSEYLHLKSVTAKPLHNCVKS